jgi:hypothetical protein
VHFEGVLRAGAAGIFDDSYKTFQRDVFELIGEGKRYQEARLGNRQHHHRDAPPICPYFKRENDAGRCAASWAAPEELHAHEAGEHRSLTPFP